MAASSEHIKSNASKSIENQHNQSLTQKIFAQRGLTPDGRVNSMGSPNKASTDTSDSEDEQDPAASERKIKLLTAANEKLQEQLKEKTECNENLKRRSELNESDRMELEALRLFRKQREEQDRIIRAAAEAKEKADREAKKAAEELDAKRKAEAAAAAAKAAQDRAIEQQRILKAQQDAVLAIQQAAIAKQQQEAQAKAAEEAKIKAMYQLHGSSSGIRMTLDGFKAHIKHIQIMQCYTTLEEALNHFHYYGNSSSLDNGCSNTR